MLLDGVNSAARWDLNSGASSLARVTPKRKPLEAWQREDARRLRDLWDAKRPKLDGKPISQEMFAETYLDASQGALFQYVDGRIPLNLDAAIKFAKGLGVTVSEISPRLGESLRHAAGLEPLGGDDLAEDEKALLQRYRAADPRWKFTMMLISWAGTDSQMSVAESANLIMGKIFSKDPAAIKPTSSRRVHKVVGDAPHVAARKARKKAKTKEPAT